MIVLFTLKQVERKDLNQLGEGFSAVHVPLGGAELLTSTDLISRNYPSNVRLQLPDVLLQFYGTIKIREFSDIAAYRLSFCIGSTIMSSSQ
jgi:hypothetical protein